MKPLVDGAEVDDTSMSVDIVPDFEAIVCAGQPLGCNMVLVKGVTKQAGRPEGRKRQTGKKPKTSAPAGRPRLDDDVTVLNADLDAAAARVPNHKYADLGGFEAGANRPVGLGGFNQRCNKDGQVCIGDEHAQYRFCCACYESGKAAEPPIAERHFCEGCRCIIHTWPCAGT